MPDGQYFSRPGHDETCPWWFSLGDGSSAHNVPASDGLLPEDNKACCWNVGRITARACCRDQSVIFKSGLVNRNRKFAEVYVCHVGLTMSEAVGGLEGKRGRKGVGDYGDSDSTLNISDIQQKRGRRFGICCHE